VEVALRFQKWALSWYSKTPRRKLTPNGFFAFFARA